MAVSIEKYSAERRQEWDEFVAGAKNGTFLFMRGYMDYHANRFADHSLMYRDENGKLLALMPGHTVNDAYYSHHGLTYGGIICSSKLQLGCLGEIFKATVEYLKSLGFKQWHYKQMPSCYHILPSEGDNYWLWQLGATIEHLDMSQCVSYINYGCTVSSRKRNYHNKLIRHGYVIKEDADLGDFWPILCKNLRERHNVSPVHTLEEIQLLQSRFPDRIRCYTVSAPSTVDADGNCIAGEILGGTVLYLTDTVVHTQYISASAEGRAAHVLDLLLLHLIETYREKAEYKYFDFGTSMDGDNLNEGLVRQKEEFGARAIAYREYLILL